MTRFHTRKFIFHGFPRQHARVGNGYDGPADVQNLPIPVSNFPS